MKTFVVETSCICQLLSCYVRVRSRISRSPYLLHGNEPLWHHWECFSLQICTTGAELLYSSTIRVARSSHTVTSVLDGTEKNMLEPQTFMLCQHSGDACAMRRLWYMTQITYSFFADVPHWQSAGIYRKSSTNSWTFLTFQFSLFEI